MTTLTPQLNCYNIKTSLSFYIEILGLFMVGAFANVSRS